MVIDVDCILKSLEYTGSSETGQRSASCLRLRSACVTLVWHPEFHSRVRRTDVWSEAGTELAENRRSRPLSPVFPYLLFERMPLRLQNGTLCVSTKTNPCRLQRTGCGFSSTFCPSSCLHYSNETFCVPAPSSFSLQQLTDRVFFFFPSLFFSVLSSNGTLWFSIRHLSTVKK